MGSPKSLDIDTITYEQILEEKCSRKEVMKSFYVFYSSTVQNFSSSPRSMYEVNTDELLVFIGNIFHLEPKDRKSLDEKAGNLKPPPYLLTVEVIEGIDLIPTDADSLSDPYCKLWVSSDRGNSKKTVAKENTRDPEWNIKYEFPVKNVKKDILHLEIWDEDSTSVLETLQEIRTVSGVRGCCLFCKDLLEVIIPGLNADDFMGKANVDIKSVFPEGRDLCLVLESKKGSRIRGSLHISTGFEINVPENEPRAIKLHLFLCRLCLIDALSRKQMEPMKCESWDDFLDETAAALLYVHGLQCNINKMAYVTCQWLVVNSRFCKGVPFSFRLLFKLIRQVQIQQKSCSSGTDLKDEFSESLKKFTPKCVGMLHHKYIRDYLANEEGSVEFEHILRCIVALQEEMPDQVPDPLKILEEEALLWYKSEIGTVLRNTTSSDVSKGIVHCLGMFVSLHKNADRVIRRVFPKFSYTGIALHQMQYVVENILQPVITEAVLMTLKVNDDVKSGRIQECVDIYVTLRNFSNFMKPFESSEESSDLQNFRDWFPVSVVTKWFEWYASEVSALLADSVDNQTFSETRTVRLPNETNDAKQDVSVEIIINHIQSKLCTLWDLINWHIPEYIESFVTGINNCCIKYSALLMDEVSQQQLIGNYSTEGCKKMPVVANSIWSLAQQIEILKAARLRGISSELADTKCELEQKCESVCSIIAHEVQKDFRKRIEEISHATSKSVQEKEIQEYRHFVDECLGFYNGSMAHAVLTCFLKKLWDHIVTIFSDITDVLIQKIWCLKLKKFLQVDLLPFHGMLESLELTKLQFLSLLSRDNENLNTMEYEKILQDLKDCSF